MIWTTPLIHLDEKQVSLADLKEGDVITLRHKDGGGAKNPFKPTEYQEFIYHADGSLTSLSAKKESNVTKRRYSVNKQRRNPVINAILSRAGYLK